MSINTMRELRNIKDELSILIIHPHIIIITFYFKIYTFMLRLPKL